MRKFLIVLLLLSILLIGAKNKGVIKSQLLVEIPVGITLDTDIPKPKQYQDGITYRGKGSGVSTIILTSDDSPFLFTDIYSFHLEGFTIQVTDGHTSDIIGIYTEKRHSNWWTIKDIRIVDPTPDEDKKHLYTAIHLRAEGENRAIHKAEIRDVWAEGVDTLIKFETIDDSNWIGEIILDNVWAQGYRILVDFPETGKGVNGSYFNFVCGQTAPYSEMGYKDIRTRGNMFLYPMVWDWRAYNEGPWMRLTPDSYENLVIIPYAEDIEDLGNNKIIQGGE